MQNYSRKGFYWNSLTIGFGPQTQKLELHYMYSKLTLGVKVLRKVAILLSSSKTEFLRTQTFVSVLPFHKLSTNCVNKIVIFLFQSVVYILRY